jgi:thiol-disulfide isomerase/thioredoxin
MSKRRFTAIAVAAVCLLAPDRARSQGAGIMVGAPAPGAMVETLDGRAVELSSYYSGRPVVIEFWATWCPLCKQLEAPLAAARAKFGSRVTFVSVGVNDNQTAAMQKRYVEAMRLGGMFVFDRDGKAVEAFKVPHTSYLVVVNAEGKVVYTGVGGDQDVDAAIARAFVMDPGPGSRTEPRRSGR